MSFCCEVFKTAFEKLRELGNEDLEGGVDRDMHGAHMIFTAGFDNVHLSHIELFNAGQPRLARYPVHWHHSGLSYSF